MLDECSADEADRRMTSLWVAAILVPLANKHILILLSQYGKDCSELGYKASLIRTPTAPANRICTAAVLHLAIFISDYDQS